MTELGQARKAKRKLKEGGQIVDRYAPARRLYELRALLDSTGGATVYEVAERLRVSVRSAIRYLEALRRAGEPLFDEPAGKRKVWKLLPTARQQTLTFTTSQMLSLFLSRRVFDFLEGTGFKEDLDEVFRKLEVTLKRKDATAARNLDRKIYDVNEAPHVYEGRLEHVNEILTALLKEQRLAVVHESVRGRARFEIDPYTLLVYKKGLYLAGFSHKHQAIRTFALDGFAEVEWQKGVRFEYPADYQPSRLYEGAFGLIAGDPVKVRLRFSKKVARFVRRRRWHPSQTIVETAEGVEVTMDLRGTAELTSWILGFGKEAPDPGAALSARGDTWRAQGGIDRVRVKSREAQLVLGDDGALRDTQRMNASPGHVGTNFRTDDRNARVILTPEEQARLVLASGHGAQGQRDTVIVLLALKAGIDAREQCRMDIGDVVPPGGSSPGYVMVPGRGEVFGPGLPPGAVPVPPAVRGQLDALVERTRADCRHDGGRFGTDVRADGVSVCHVCRQPLDLARVPLLRSRGGARLSERQVHKMFGIARQRARLSPAHTFEALVRTHHAQLRELLVAAIHNQR